MKYTSAALIFRKIYSRNIEYCKTCSKFKRKSITLVTCTFDKKYRKKQKDKWVNENNWSKYNTPNTKCPFYQRQEKHRKIKDKLDKI